MQPEKPHGDPAAYERPVVRRPATAEGTIDEKRARHDPYAAFRIRAYGFYSLGNLISVIGRQMLVVAIEWEIYQRTHSATALGLVGLVIAGPVILLSLPAGHLADRFNRKYIILLSQALSAICSLGLAAISWQHLAIPRLGFLEWGNRVLTSVASIFERTLNLSLR